MTHIAEYATRPNYGILRPNHNAHPTVDDALGCNLCYDASTVAMVRKSRMENEAVEAVKNLFECAIGWMPLNFTTQDAADLSDELRADRDTAIRAIRGYV